LFRELEPSDLDYLGILNSEHRAKLLAAVQLLSVIADSNGYEVAESSSENDESRSNHAQKPQSGISPFGRRHFPRDSGCYEGAVMPNVNITQNIHENRCFDELMVAQCSANIPKRVENARILPLNKHQQESPSKKGFMKKGLLGGASLNDEGGAFSEKSSDSGVSSSSLSGPLKN
jgi:SAM and SH3 domain-containing protein 1